MKTRKVLAIFACAALLVAATVGATLAYLTDKTEAVVNTFTVGNVKITLDEAKVGTDGKALTGDDAARVKANSYVMYPAHVYDKDPVVTNVGTNDAWVRVNVTLSDWVAFQTAVAKHYEGTFDLTNVFGGFDSANWTLANVTETAGTTDADKTVTYSYYYKTVLAANETKDSKTGALFTTVTVPALFDETDMESLGEDFTITVTADAIQADGFDTVTAAFAAFDAQKAAN